jgi:hypothetical protein
VRFGSADLEALLSVQPVAEDLVGEHFQLTSFGPYHRCYEIVTAATADEDCREATALAKLRRYDRQERPISDERRVARFYQVCLQDEAILKRVADGLDLKALLLYVLTHELVHIVRFESFQVHFDAPETVRESEEKTVHRLTEQMLKELKDSAVDAVVAGLAPGGVDVLVAQR